MRCHFSTVIGRHCRHLPLVLHVHAGRLPAEALLVTPLALVQSLAGKLTGRYCYPARQHHAFT
jgi:hypothetical protein